MTTHDLLQNGATREVRGGITRESGIAEALILRQMNHVDLYRIKGVECLHAELLKSSGVN